MRAAVGRLIGIILVAGCVSQGEQSLAVPAWEVSARPTISVGDRDESDSAVFALVTDARLTESGSLIVADGRASVVIVFDNTGTERVRLGRKGRGPGEFTGAMTLAGLSADSLVVWDPGQSRWTLMAGAAPTLYPTARVVGPAAWMHAGVLVRGEQARVPAWVPPTLQALSDSLPELRFGFLDETALLWVNTDATGREWRAYSEQSAVGRIVLPLSMRPTQFRSDAVVGVQSDSLGLERVVVHTLTRPSGITPDHRPATPPAPDSTARANLMAAMRTSVMAQEMHYAQAGSYTMRSDSLSVAMPEGARFRVLDANDRGWRGVGWFTATGFSCGMIVGGVPPRGWSEGEVRCAW